MLFEKVTVSKSAVQNLGFLKSRVFGKNYKEMFLKKVKCLVNTYKSGVLSCKLPKNDKMYI